MLNTLRKSISGPLVKIFIGLLVLSFAVWGIQDIFGNYGSRIIAKIDKIELTVENYIDEYNQQLSMISRNMGRKITQEESLLMGVDREVLRKLIIDGLTVASTVATLSDMYISSVLLHSNTKKPQLQFLNELQLRLILPIYILLVKSDIFEVRLFPLNATCWRGYPSGYFANFGYRRH